jgi:tRNA threonylcarbamoyladenosine biosynthesis protein TsaE
MKKLTFRSYSANDTVAFANKLARTLHKGDVVGLFGDLGSGKTTFVKGLAAGLGLKTKINSPSFVILKVYCRGAKRKDIHLYHFDLYRLKSLKELEDIGYEDFINSDAICVIEWADKAKSLLPKEYLRINIRIKGENKRAMNIISCGTVYDGLINRLRIEK